MARVVGPISHSSAPPRDGAAGARKDSAMCTSLGGKAGAAFAQVACVVSRGHNEAETASGRDGGQEVSYRPARLGTRLLGMPCLIDNYPDGPLEETLLAGKYGLIWAYGSGRYFVLVHNQRIASKWLSCYLALGDEQGIVVSEAIAKKWTKRLRVPRNRASQMKCLELVA